MSVPVNYGSLSEIQMQKDELLYMENIIKAMPSNGLFVEWGSGGSTVHWLKTMTGDQKLISIEHNKEWYTKVDTNLDEYYSEEKKRLTYYYRREMYGFEHGYATVIEEHPFGTDQYLYPDAAIQDADVFFIDGIARATVALLVLFLSTKSNPCIFIHDYAGREKWYEWAVQFYPKKEIVGSTLLRLWK